MSQTPAITATRNDGEPGRGVGGTQEGTDTCHLAASRLQPLPIMSPEETQDVKTQDTGPRQLTCISKEWFQWAQTFASSHTQKGGSDGKASACKVGDPDSIPGSGRSPGEGNGNPFQYSCLENSMDGGAWWAILHGVAKSQTWLNGFTCCCCCIHRTTLNFLTWDIWFL